MNRRTSRSLAFALVTCALSLPALATPLRVQFNGAVTGGSGLPNSNNVLNEFPVGSAASFDVTFDDANLGLSAPTQDDLAPVSGSVRLGALEWLLDAGRIKTFSYQYLPVEYYGLQLTGSGPSINYNGSLYGLLLFISSNLSPSPTDGFSIGFRFPDTNGSQYFRYADVSGTYSMTRGAVSVPEPNALLITALAFALLGLSSPKAREFTRRAIR